MPLEGSLFLAFWNDFDPARDDEYKRWHTFEHVPERAAERADNRFFTPYEVQDEAVLESASYLNLVHNPTAWSRGMRPSFRNVLRLPCETLLSTGRGMGGHVATARLALPRRLTAEDGRVLRTAPRLPYGDLPPVVLHLGQFVANLSDYPVFRSGQQTSQAPGQGSVALAAEAGDRQAALAAVTRCVAELRELIGDVGVLATATYDLACVVEHHGIGEHPTGRDVRAAAQAA